MDFISLGYKCETSLFLKKNNLRDISYPFDWIITMSLKTINQILNDENFKLNYLKNIKDYSSNKKYLKFFGASKNVKNLLYLSNNYKGLIFRHFDFLNDKNNKETIQRRLDRFYDRLKNNKNSITFIRILHDGNVNERLKKSSIDIGFILSDINKEELKKQIENFFFILKKKYNRENDKLILINNIDIKLNDKRVKIIKNINYIINEN